MPVVVVEVKRGPDALRRSVRLVRRRRWQLLGVLAVSGFVGTALIVIIGSVLRALGSLAPDGALVELAVDVLASATAWTLVVPFLAATICLLYFDLVVRKEGLDAESLAKWIDDAPHPTKAKDSGKRRRDPKLGARKGDEKPPARAPRKPPPRSRPAPKEGA